MSDGRQALDFVYLVGCLVLVLSALSVRRIPIRQSLKMALAWILIFAAAFILFALRDDFGQLGRRLLAEVRGEAGVVTEGQKVRIRRSEDGHFWVNASLNGKTFLFLVDSGATVTTLSAETARRAGVEPNSPLPVLVNTANGTVTQRRGSVDLFTLGPITRENLDVHISERDDVDVIGMNFLSSLAGWGTKDGWLVLEP